MKPLNLTARNRLLVASAIGACFAALAAGWLTHAAPGLEGGDFTYAWAAARALLAGHDPYRSMADARVPFYGSHRLFYPLPAVLLALPFASLPVVPAAATFVGAGITLLAFAATRRAWWPLLMFASAPAMAVATSVQWSPLLTAAALWPFALGVGVAKPTIGVALIAVQSDWRAALRGAAFGLLLVVVTLVLVPAWPAEWLAEMRSSPLMAQYHVPILSAWGAPVTLAALAWRNPKARLLVAMACVPQNGFFYDQLPLLLIPASRVSLTAACLISVGAATLAHAAIGAKMSPPVAVSAVWWPYVTVGMYWPALWFVLAPRFADVSIGVWIRKNWITAVIVTAVVLIQAYWLLHSNGYGLRIPPRP